MIKKVKITKVFVATHPKDKPEEPYTYKNGKNAGKPFVRVSIKTEQTGDDYYSTNAFPDSKPTKLQEGDEVLLSLTEDNGFKNFNFPTQEQLAELAQKALDASE